MSTKGLTFSCCIHDIGDKIHDIGDKLHLNQYARAKLSTRANFGMVNKIIPITKMMLPVVVQVPSTK